MIKKILPVVLAVSLALSAAVIPVTEVSAADKVKIKVITSITDNIGSKQYSLSYNKNGLINKINYYNSTVYNISYDSDYMIKKTKVTKSTLAGKIKYTLSTVKNDSGNVKKLKSTNKKEGSPTVYTYDDEERIKTAVVNRGSDKHKYKFTYDSKDRIKKFTFATSSGTLAYNKAGNLSKYTEVKNYGNGPITMRYKYTYTKNKKGLVTSCTQKNVDYGSTLKRKFKYKTVLVPEDAEDVVREQQWALINRNANQAFTYAGINALEMN